MYRIKPKKGYNVIISDLNLVLKSANDTWINVEEDKLNNSTDAKAVWNLLIIEDAAKVDDKKKETKKETKPVQTEKTTFVAHEKKEKQPEGVFVAQPKEVEEIKVEEKTEEKVEEVKTEKVETPKTEKKQDEKKQDKKKKATTIETAEN